MTRIFEHSSTDGDIPVRVLLALAERAQAQGRQWVVVGAAARDLLVHVPLGHPPTRATTDIDIAIAVAVEREFQDFAEGLPSLDAGIHKFAVHGIEVDIVPFGAIEVDGSIRFPNDHVLDVIGLREAALDPDIVVLPNGVPIPVAPAEVQVALKLLAWRDRHRYVSKDAIDLRTLLAASSEGPYADEAWEDEEALEACGYTIDLAGAYRFGRLASSRFAVERAQPVLDLLRASADVLTLKAEMGGRAPGEQLDAYHRGFEVGLRPADP